MGTTPSYFSKINFNIVFLPVSFFLAFPPRLCILGLVHACYIPTPFNHPWFYHYNYNWWVQVMKHPIMQICNLSFHPFSVQTFSSALFSNPASMCVFPLMSETKFHAYKTVCNIAILHNSILTHLEKQECKRFWSEWWQAVTTFHLLWISSWIKLWFVTIDPKYWILSH
jgi:hypothetical protein